MGLEFDRNRKVGLSPHTVLPTPRRHSCTEKRSTKGKSKRRDDLLSIKEDFVEINFIHYRSTSCKSVPSRPLGVGQEVNSDVKRGSIYQCSNEVRKIKKLGSIDERRKIEMPRRSDTSFAYRIVDSVCSSDEESSLNRSSVIALKSDLITPCVGRPHVESFASDSLIDICLDPDDREEEHSAEALEECSVDLKLRSSPVAGPLNNGNELHERDQVHTLHKSFSAKVEMLQSPSPAASARSSRASSKARFSPIRKMFDPFIKSKSLRSPSYIVEPGGATMKINRTHKNSSDCDLQFIRGDNHQSLVTSSPVHLHGQLKIQNKHGMPYIEFSSKCSEDAFVARTWKVENGFNWGYAFHSVGGRKRSNASGWGSYGGGIDSSMVGLMQVSCYLSSELTDGVVDNSIVTEFVLYDIAHARQSFTAQETSVCGLDDVKPSKSTVGSSLRWDGSSSAWASADLHPNLEIAAVVMQVPFEKRESLKYKRGDTNSDKVQRKGLNLSMGKQDKEVISNRQSPGNMKVVIPAGNHGFPSDETSRGPSPLLGRWRTGGGCDCGGWDMSCPLIVLSNPIIPCADDQLLVENQQPLEFFVEGSKEKTPSLTMTVVEEGQYAVDFHAQLSTLQAFSICVAILHGSETPASAGQEGNVHLSQCNSLKVLIEEEVKHLIEAVTTGEKKVQNIQPSFVLNPPFSPIARV